MRLASTLAVERTGEALGKVFGWVTTSVTPASYAITNGSQVVKNPSFAAIFMHLVGHLSKPSTRLQIVLDAFPKGSRKATAGAHRPIVSQPSLQRLGNGVVQRAVVQALAAAGRTMRRAEVQTAVESLLGQPVSQNSIDWCLSNGAQGTAPTFARVARGHYRLIDPQ